MSYAGRSPDAYRDVMVEDSFFERKGFPMPDANNVQGPKNKPERERASFPVIQEYGPAYSVPGAFEVPERKRDVRAVFDIAAPPDRPDEVSAGLKRIARYLNLYVAVGVDPHLIRSVAVFHGAATSAVLRDDAYCRTTGAAKANPNAPLIKELHRAGVTLYVCGQAMRDSGFSDADILPDVGLAYSALSVLTNYQEQNYAFFSV